MKITERVIREVWLTEDDRNALWAIHNLLDEMSDAFADDEASRLIDKMTDCLSDLEAYLSMNTEG